MRPYELVIIFGPHIQGDELVDAQLEKVSEVITRNGGQIDNISKWGRRRFAYEIDGNTEGYYAVIDLSAEEETTRAVEHSLKISDDVIRHLLVRKPEVDEEAPAEAATS